LLSGGRYILEVSMVSREKKTNGIKMLGLAEAEGGLKDFYDLLKARAGARPPVYNSPGGEIPNIIKAHSLDLEGMKLASGISAAVHGGPFSLPWKEREMLNTVVSSTNRCFYCVSAHAEFLRAASRDRKLAAQVKANFRKAKLSGRHSHMLEFVEKLTRSPWRVSGRDSDSLRSAGFNDDEILHIVLGAAHLNYLNRVADGLGIELDYEVSLARFRPADRFGREPAINENEKAPLSKERGAIPWIFSPVWQKLDSLCGPRNLFRALGGNPEARDLARKWRAYQLKATPGLSARERGLVAFYSSNLMECNYCAHWYLKGLAEMGEDPALLVKLAQGVIPDSTTDRDQSILIHAGRLACAPWTIKEMNLADLRRARLDDKAILQLTMLAGYISFEIRVALGLSVALES
jgi:uncharacterized peroxidase-related enzyme